MVYLGGDSGNPVWEQGVREGMETAIWDMLSSLQRTVRVQHCGESLGDGTNSRWSVIPGAREHPFLRRILGGVARGAVNSLALSAFPVWAAGLLKLWTETLRQKQADLAVRSGSEPPGGFRAMCQARTVPGSPWRW